MKNKIKKFREYLDYLKSENVKEGIFRIKTPDEYYLYISILDDVNEKFIKIFEK